MKTPKPSTPALGRQTFEIESVSDLIDAFTSLRQPNFFARGEPKEYPEPWLPSIWRQDHNYQDRTPVLGGTYTRSELDILQQCQADVRSGTLDDRYFRHFFTDHDAEITLDSVDLLHWTSLAQHYNQNLRYPTRLLDVTTNPFVALYFAASSHFDDDGFVVWKSIGNGSNDLSHLPITETLGTFLDVVTIQASDGGTDYRPLDDTLNFMRPPLPNLRTEAQSGAFIWTRGNERSLLGTGFALRVVGRKKRDILRDLEALNITERSLFPT